MKRGSVFLTEHQKRGSVFFSDQLQSLYSEQAVTVRHTEYSSVALKSKATKEKISQQTSHMSSLKENVKLPAIGLDKDELSKKIAQSMHLNIHSHLKVIDMENRGPKSKLKNVNSIHSRTELCSLPSLQHAR